MGLANWPSWLKYLTLGGLGSLPLWIGPLVEHLQNVTRQRTSPALPDINFQPEWMAPTVMPSTVAPVQSVPQIDPWAQPAMIDWLLAQPPPYQPVMEPDPVLQMRILPEIR